MTSEQIAQNVRIIWAKYIGIQNNISDEEINQFASTIEAIEVKPCEDCVRRKDAISTVNNIYNSCRDCTMEEYRDTMIESFKVLCGVHSARKIGKWIVEEDCEGKTRTCTCNLCGYETGEYTWENPNYCENCGAEMAGELDGN